jgi:hypothetical protein
VRKLDRERRDEAVFRASLQGDQLNRLPSAIDLGVLCSKLARALLAHEDSAVGEFDHRILRR